MKKILVIQTASIGDVILVTPMLESLHKQYPECHIHLMVKKGTETLFYFHPYVKKVFMWDKSQKKYRNLYHTLKRIQNERYDLVVNVQRFFLTGVVTAFSRAKRTVGFNKNPMSIFFSQRVKHKIKTGEMHETDRNLLLLKGIVENPVRQPKLYPDADDDALTSQFKTHRYICVAPASLWFTKQFPAHKWVEFLKKVPDDLYVYLLGSQADHKLCDEIISDSGHKNILNLAGKMKLLETASLMRDAAMNYVNDSAPMHLSSSVNAPTTAVFCSTIPAFGFGPLSDDSCVIEIDFELDCRPCGLHGLPACPEKHFNCANKINKEKLMDRIR